MADIGATVLEYARLAVLYVRENFNHVVAAVILVAAAALLWDLFKKIASTAGKLLLNSVAGVLILLFLNTFLRWNIPVNVATLVVCGLFGVPGVGTLILLYLFKMF